MSRVYPVDPTTSQGKAKQLLDAVKSKLGLVPNMTKVMANAPAVLEAYLGFSGALGQGTLQPQLRERIALITAQQNHCDYCLSAHTAIGKMVGLNESEVVGSRQGRASDAKTTAALTFARQIIETKGQVTDEQVAEVRAAGYSDQEILEIIAHVALNVFTNYFNSATQVEIDFPKVSFAKVA